MSEKVKCEVERPKIRVRLYSLVAEAVEQGVGYGYMRAHKHVEAPEEDHLKNEITQAVLNAICEIIDFDPDETGRA